VVDSVGSLSDQGKYKYLAAFFVEVPVPLIVTRAKVDTATCEQESNKRMIHHSREIIIIISFLERPLRCFLPIERSDRRGLVCAVGGHT
jgi:hypothetical protein